MGLVLLVGGALLAVLVLQGGGGGPPAGAGPGAVPAELEPFTRTSTGWRNDPPEEVWPALQRTRDLYRGWFEPIAVFTSAYRSAVVNAAVGSELGVASSHVSGRGLDLVERPPHSRGALRAQAIAAKLAGQISSWVDEGDHIHVEW